MLFGDIGNPNWLIFFGGVETTSIHQPVVWVYLLWHTIQSDHGSLVPQEGRITLPAAVNGHEDEEENVGSAGGRDKWAFQLWKWWRTLFSWGRTLPVAIVLGGNVSWNSHSHLGVIIWPIAVAIHQVDRRMALAAAMFPGHAPPSPSATPGNLSQSLARKWWLLLAVYSPTLLAVMYFTWVSNGCSLKKMRAKGRGAAKGRDDEADQ